MNTVEKLKSIGGNEWIKGDMHRFYFSNLEECIDLKIERFGTGNIFRAVYEGKEISNRSARTIIDDLNMTKVWFDIKENKFSFKGIREYAETAIEFLTKKMSEV